MEEVTNSKTVMSKQLSGRVYIGWMPKALQVFIILSAIITVSIVNILYFYDSIYLSNWRIETLVIFGIIVITVTLYYLKFSNIYIHENKIISEKLIAPSKIYCMDDLIRIRDPYIFLSLTTRIVEFADGSRYWIFVAPSIIFESIEKMESIDSLIMKRLAILK